MSKFANHRGYATMFKEGHTTLRLFFPIEAYSGAIPDMDIVTQINAIGVNHVGLNLKYGRRPAKDVVQELGEHVAPHFPALGPT